MTACLPRFAADCVLFGSAYDQNVLAGHTTRRIMNDAPLTGYSSAVPCACDLGAEL